MRYTVDAAFSLSVAGVFSARNAYREIRPFLRRHTAIHSDIAASVVAGELLDCTLQLLL